ncbi:uncharacterized protein N7503_007154 [Penicillium pulvis]|uniref:uncharacterized protein n=1 Tax=Penicillium pulvis TaxID=1562058 RepID=UPI002548BCBE|nr:uncharacterized protein N7503_007154 [Penicillium pulvis]KAJ5797858.1 hypothetical protein N7503_007154 [Penicillium pulvis]
MDPDASIPAEPAPSVFSYVLSFLLVGVAWGFTTPFIRRAAADFNARQERQASGSDTTRGRSRSQGEGEEEQELLATEEQGQNEGVRRRSGSQQRAEEEGDGSAAQLNAELEGEADIDNAPGPVPVWKRRTSSGSWVKRKIVSIFWTVINLLRTPAYSIPLVINLTGSIWFFLLVGKHELSLTVPLANSSAFLFTVLGEWYVERKVIAKQTWLGLILVLGGIALCVHSKNQTV